VEDTEGLARSLTLERDDRYSEVREAIAPHREKHGCAIPLMDPTDGRELSVITRVSHSTYVLELGSALGYAGLHVVESFGRTGKLDIIEYDEEHSRLASEAFARFAYSDRVRLHTGSAREILIALNGPYDLVIVNAGWASLGQSYDDLVRVTRIGGSLLLRTSTAESDADRDGARAAAVRMAEDYRLAPWFEPGLQTILASRVR
jgi:predicted O-methyltransferase YrrM